MVASVVQRALVTLLIAAVCMGASGCSSAPAVQPRGRVEVPVSTDSAAVRARAEPLNEVAVHLPPLITARTQWELIQNDSRFLQPTRPIEPRAEGGFVATFLALRQGRKLIRFLALPPGQREAVPTQSHQVLIEIQ